MPRRPANIPPQWWLVYVLATVTPVVVIRPAAESFHLPKATALLLGGVTLAAVLVWRSARLATFPLVRTPFHWAFAAYLFAAVIATATSDSPYLSLWGEYRYFTGLWTVLAVGVVVVAVSTESSETRYRHLLGATVLGSVPVVLYGLLQLVGADPFHWAGEVRGVFSTLGNPNFLAGYLAIVFPLMLTYGWIQGRTRLGVAAWSLALLTLPVIVASQSFQGPVGALTGSVVPIGLFLRRRTSRRTFLAITAAVLAVGAAAAVALNDLIRAQIADGIRERALMWETAISIFREEPVLGTGLSTFGIAFTPHRPLEHTRLGFLNPEQAHNVALNHLAEGGLVLFTAWVATVLVVGYLLVAGLRRTQCQRQILLAGFGGAWLAYQTQALVSIDLPLTVLLHWVSATAIAALAWTSAPREDGKRRLKTKPSDIDVAIRTATVMVAVVLGWLVLAPLRADLLAVSGFQALNRGDREGLSELESATELASGRATYWLLLAAASQGTGNAAAALDAAQTGAMLDAGSSRQALLVGQLAEEAGRPDLAADWYRRAVNRDPLHAEVLESAASFFERVGNDDRADALREEAKLLRDLLNRATDAPRWP